MAKVILYIAASIDGFVARHDGGIDWLSIVEREGEDYGYAAFYDSVDALVMGRKTYVLSLGFKEWPYPGKRSFVFSRRALKTSREDVVFVSGSVADVLERIEAEGFRRIWLVGGGELTGSFLREDMIDEYVISTIPIILGEGIPLFPAPVREILLELIGTKQFPSGLVQVHYRRKRDA